MRHYKKTTVNLHLTMSHETAGGCAFDAVGPIAMFVKAVNLTDVKGKTTPKLVIPPTIMEAIEKLKIVPVVKQRGVNYSVDIMCHAVDPENPVWMGCVDFVTDYSLDNDKSLLIYFNEITLRIKEAIAAFQARHRPNTFDEQCQDVATFIRTQTADLIAVKSHYPNIDAKFHHSIHYIRNDYGNWLLCIRIVDNATMRPLREEQFVLAKLSFF